MDLRPFKLVDFGGKPFKLARHYYIASVVPKFLGLLASPFGRTFNPESDDLIDVEIERLDKDVDPASLSQDDADHLVAQVQKRFI